MDNPKPKDPRGGPRPKVRPDDRRGSHFIAVDKDGKPMGNQHHEPREEYRALVREAAEKGQTQDMIARRLNLSVATLNRYYHDDWQQGADKLLSGIADKTVSMALEGNVSCLIFLMKTRLGYKTGVEISTPNNRPLDVNINFDIDSVLDQFDQDQITALEALLESAHQQNSTTGATQQPGNDSAQS